MSKIDFYIKQIYQEAEEILENFVRNNKPIEIPIDDFLSMFVWYFDMDNKIGEKPKIFNDLINDYFNLNSNNIFTRLRVNCDSRWGAIHVKQPISRFSRINPQDSKVIVLKERIQKLRLDLGVGGSDLAYKLNFLDIAL